MMKKYLLTLFLIILFIPHFAKADIVSNIVGWWRMDTTDYLTTTSLADRSGYKNNGTLSNMTSTSTVFGKIGQALKFNGTSQSIKMATTSVNAGLLNFTGAFTISAWIKGTYSGLNSIVTKYDSGFAQNQSYYMAINTNELRCFINADTTSNNQKISQGSVVIATSTWEYVAVTWTGSNTNCNLYLNGTSTPFTTSNVGTVNGILISTTTDMAIAGRFAIAPTMNDYFNGTIDDVRIYSRALSVGDIRQLYNLGLASHSK
jgi:Concanavalin A-like lectin/glucanases superfamily